MGGKVPRNVKEKAIRQWMDGMTRENIRKEYGRGAGTITAIIQEARKQKEYQDIDLLREVSLKLKEEGTELSLLAFAIRLKRIMEENGINEDQIESIIQEFAAYGLHNISYDAIIKSEREALYLEEKYDFPLERIPEFITQGKGTIDRLEAQRLEILRQKQHELEELDAIRQERDAIVAELEKYGQEIPSIMRIRELEAKLNEAKKFNEYYETRIIGLEKELCIVGLEAMRSEGERIEADGRCKSYMRQLSLILDKEDKLRQEK